MQQVDPQQLEHLNWEETIDFLTKDMPADEIDIVELSSRYKQYIDTMEEFDLEVPARAIRICSALLNMKSAIVLEYEEEMDEEEPQENPMDFEEEPEEEEQVDLGTPPDLEMPVQPRPKRRMHKNELKDALRDALEVKERREERVEERHEMEEQFEFEEDTLQDKIDSLHSKVMGMIGKSKDKVKFDRLLEQQTSEEKIEKFMHVLNLENDKKVTCIQEEFLGDLHVKPEEDEA
jgi:chromatin segregation and condensation protein Rec8/ScpA/Scc1 (kleisin family)